MCFLNPPKLAMDEASDGASMPHGLMASWPMPQGLVHLGSLVVSQGVQTLCPTGWQHNVGANGEGCH